ncbi:hypothetical protein [Actinoplanes sp. NPDC049681]|uniref:hypothetical protein n=1 Tax=Actinoplanes sp. NPDC049681 TaxID=3363905 RepID=UPI003796C34E
MWSEIRTPYSAADALAWLPAQADNAVALSTRAVAAYADRTDPAWAFGDEAGSHAELAISRIASRDIEAARRPVGSQAWLETAAMEIPRSVVVVRIAAGALWML